MLDPKKLRSDPDAVAANLARRGYDFDVIAFRELDSKRKALDVEIGRLRNERNTRAKSIGAAKARGEDIEPLKAEVAEAGEALKTAEAQGEALHEALDALLLGMPNLLDDSVPDGNDENDNVEIRRWGEPREFDFEPRDHVDVGADRKSVV